MTRDSAGRANPTGNRVPPNSFSDLRAAGGVLVDARKYCKGTLAVRDVQAQLIPDDAWLPAIRAGRGGGVRAA
jgi:hypothetical protein